MKTPVRFLILACAFGAVARGLAADSAPRSAEADNRSRLQRNLEAYHRLSPEMKAKVRKLDQVLNDEDTATRQRLFGVMDRYAAWHSRLSDADRDRIEAIPPGPERIQAVRSTLDRQWYDNLPQTQRDALASRPAERAQLLEKWKTEDRDRRTARADAIRDLEFGATGLPLGKLEYRDELQRYVKETLEPKLNDRERRRLNNAWRTSWPMYVIQVAMLSDAHNLRPPGPPEAWRRLADRKPRFAPP